MIYGVILVSSSWVLSLKSSSTSRPRPRPERWTQYGAARGVARGGCPLPCRLARRPRLSRAA